VRPLNPRLQLKYNKFYIGLAVDGRANNFVIFRPQKNGVRLEPRIDKTAEVDEMIEAADLDVLEYDARWSRYKIRLKKGDVSKHADVIRQLLDVSYREFGGGDS